MGGQSVTVGHYNADGELVSTSYYAHLDHVNAWVKPGAAVTAGQQLGRVGQTGNAGASDPHLHLKVKNKVTGEAVDMETTLGVRRVP